MGITPSPNNLREVHKELMQGYERIKKLTLRALAYLGEQCVTRVRDRSGVDSWFDDTGALRSSIGYVIAYKGQIIQYSDFTTVGNGADGSREGREFAEQIVKTFSNEFVLIVVAGRHYAEYVEAKDNKDVLASTELWARGEVPKMIQKLNRQLVK